MEKNKDRIVRATAAGGQVRAFAAYTKNTVETARRAHETSPIITAALGRLLTAGAMMGSMMKGENDLITLRIEGSGAAGTILVTADSHGNVKGYPSEPIVILPANDRGKLDVAGAIGPGYLTVIKDMGLKEPYNGTIELVSGEIAEDITYYFASSEQTPSSVGLGVLMNHENTVQEAGGFIIQLMPDATEETISHLEEKLSGIDSVTNLLKEGNTPEDIINMILEGLEPEILDTIETGFNCNCSMERVSRSLALLSAEDLESLVKDNEPIEVKCHFCNKSYSFPVERLREFLDKK